MKTIMGRTISLDEWRYLGHVLPGQRYWFHKERHLQVIESEPAQADDGRKWFHVSCVKRYSETHFELPGWDDLKLVWAQFVGEDHVAYQMFPRKRDWVNIHPHVLHLWHCPAEDYVLPNFGSKGTI